MNEQDLPGGWSRSDFEGGDPDERSYAERGWARVDLKDMQDRIYDGFGAPLYAHQIEWRNPVAMTVESRVDIETMEIMIGLPLIQLCNRQLPPKGQE